MRRNVRDIIILIFMITMGILISQKSYAEGEVTTAKEQYTLRMYNQDNCQTFYIDKDESSEILCPIENFGWSPKSVKKIHDKFYKLDQDYLNLNETDLLCIDGKWYIKLKRMSGEVFSLVKTSKTGLTITTYQMNTTPRQEIEFREVEKIGKANVNGNLIMVNRDNPYVYDKSRSLTSLRDKGILVSNANISLDSKAITPLKSMMTNAKANGYHLVVVSGYRSKTKQQAILNQMIQTYKPLYKDYMSKAYLAVMPPGYSEHETGLAVDIFSTSKMTFNSFTGSKEAKWLQANAHKYGFILRYPAGKTGITRIKYEPWHFRYVGKEVSNYIYKHGLTYEEFVDQLKEGLVIDFEGSTYVYFEAAKSLSLPIGKSNLEVNRYLINAKKECVRIKLN